MSDFFHVSAGDELFSLAEARAYSITVLGGGRAYLTFGERKVKNPQVLAETYKIPPPLSYKGGFSRVDFIGNRLFRKEELEGIRAIYAKLSDRNGSHADLIARRDALEKQILRYAELIAGHFEEIRSVLSVWHVESEASISPSPTLAESTDEERQAYHDLAFHSRLLWKRIVSGVPTEHIERGLLPFLSQFGISPALAEAQALGVLVGLEKRDAIIQEAFPFARNLLAHEWKVMQVIGGMFDVDEEVKRIERRAPVSIAPHDYEFKGGRIIWQGAPKDLAYILRELDPKYCGVRKGSWTARVRWAERHFEMPGVQRESLIRYVGEHEPVSDPAFLNRILENIEDFLQGS